MMPLVAAACLLLAILAYGCSSLMLAEGAIADVKAHKSPVWWLGTAFQGLGFVAAFAARQHLSLLLVQSASAASLAVTALLGAALHRWTVSRADLLWIAALMAGIAAIPGVTSAGAPRPLDVVPALVAAASVAAAAVCTMLSAHPLVRGSAAGLAFGATAFMSRPFVSGLTGHAAAPTQVSALLIIVAGVLVGQICLTSALSTRRVGGPVAAMYLVETLLPGLAGMAWLGDGVRTGGVWAACLGVALAVVAAQRLAGHGYGHEVTEPATSATQDRLA